MGQSLLLAGLAGVLAAGAPGQDPGPSPAETASEVRRCDVDPLDCWLAAEGGGTVSVVISEPLGEAPEDLAERLAAGTSGGEQRARLVVSVTSEEGTGALGTVLFALAGGEGARFADPEALIDPLGGQERGALDGAPSAVCGAECRDAAARLDLRDPLLGEEVISAGLAEEAVSGLVVPPEGDEDEGGGDGASPPVVALAAGLGALFAALVAFLVVAVRRTSPPAPAPAQRHDGGREGTVRSVLRPQGYVEINGVLYRAEWAGPHGSPPAPGERVEVVEGGAGVLLAYAPVGTSRRGGAT